jgi:hypothetical protein
LKRGSRVRPLIDAVLLGSSEITMKTARAAAAFMLMFNFIEENKTPKRKVR